MPDKISKFCKHINCSKIIPGGIGAYCDEHAKPDTFIKRKQKNYLYDGRWRKARLTYLNNHPLCVICLKEDRLEPATLIDHIKPHRGDTHLFWNTSNWQPLCKRCHDTKTAKEDGGFGNKTNN